MDKKPFSRYQKLDKQKHGKCKPDANADRTKQLQIIPIPPNSEGVKWTLERSQNESLLRSISPDNIVAKMIISQENKEAVRKKGHTRCKRRLSNARKFLTGLYMGLVTHWQRGSFQQVGVSLQEQIQHALANRHPVSLIWAVF